MKDNLIPNILIWGGGTLFVHGLTTQQKKTRKPAMIAGMAGVAAGFAWRAVSASKTPTGDPVTTLPTY